MGGKVCGEATPPTFSPGDSPGTGMIKHASQLVDLTPTADVVDEGVRDASSPKNIISEIAAKTVPEFGLDGALAQETLDNNATFIKKTDFFDDDLENRKKD